MVLFLGKSFRLVAEADPSAGPVWNGEAFKGLLRNRKLQPNPSTFPKQSDWRKHLRFQNQRCAPGVN